MSPTPFFPIHASFFFQFLNYFIVVQLQLSAFFNCSKQHINFTILTILMVQFSSVNYNHIVIQPISRTLFISYYKTLYPLGNNSSFLPPPAPDNHHSTFCFYDFDYSRHIILVESKSIWVCVCMCVCITGLFQLAWYPQGLCICEL